MSMTGEMLWKRDKVEPAHPARDGCGCPACVGLDCFERPRFFAGQLLTEAELGGQMEYVLDKNRLHNRYLHGWGVVCGLEVSCHECEGLVRVHQGYAIDPCGNDVVVCRGTDVDVIKLIRECRDARTRTGDCDPWEPVTEVGCDDREEHWCLSIEFDERDARPISPLRDSSGRGCSCKSCGPGNGNGNGHGTASASCGSCATGCDCGRRSSTCGCSASVTATRGVSALTGVVACEPTRVREGFRFSVCELPEGCAGERSREGLMTGTLFGRIVGCLSTIWGFMGKRVATGQWSVLTAMMVAPKDDASDVAYSEAPAKMYDSYCSLYKGVLDLYRENPFNVRCRLPSAFEQLHCDPPGQLESYEYGKSLQPQTWHLMTLLLQYAIDCACQAILPSCSPDPRSDRVGLACVTVKGGTIVRICNLSCRRYAGSFPAVGWWTSIVPALPMIAAALARICCGPDLVRAQSPLVNTVFEMVKGLGIDRELREVVRGEGPKAIAQLVATLPQRVDLRAAVQAVAPHLAGTNLTRFVGMTEAGAEAELAAKGHTVEIRELSPDEVVAPTMAPTTVVAPPESEVVVLVKDGMVVGARHERARARGVGAGASVHDLSILRSEVATLRKEVDRLRAAPAAKATKATKARETKARETKTGEAQAREAAKRAKESRATKASRRSKTTRTPPERGGSR